MFHATGLVIADVPDSLTGNCGSEPGIACRLAWDISHSTTATQVVKVYLAGPVSQTAGLVPGRHRLPGPLRGGPDPDPGADGGGREQPVPRGRLEVGPRVAGPVKAALDEAGVQPAGPDTIVISAPPVPAIGSSAAPPEAVADEEETVTPETS